jgi:hypothetical protein
MRNADCSGMILFSAPSGASHRLASLQGIIKGEIMLGIEWQPAAKILTVAPQGKLAVEDFSR